MTVKETKMTVNGVSVCAAGEENYEEVVAGAFRGKSYFHYDYRHTDGTLYSTVQPTLEECRRKRDLWLAVKEGLI